MPVLNIDTSAIVAFTAKLERMHRSALPVAVRSTLNSAAFDVKKNTMPDSAKRAFLQRKPSFFKANSKVEQAQGFDLMSMKATVGFTGRDQAVEDLEKQESGGSIGGRAFIPLKAARVSGSWNKNVRANARMNQIKGKLVKAGNAGPKNGETSKKKYIKSAVHAGKGGFLIGSGAKGGNIVFQVRSLKRIKGNTVVKAVPMFSVVKGRKVNPKATHFMKSASEKSGNKMDRIFIEQAQKQIARLR